MKIDFENNISDFQDARRLKMILEHYSHSILLDKNTQLFLESLLSQINIFVSNPAFKGFYQSAEIYTSEPVQEPHGKTLLDELYARWRRLTGPTRRELALSSQRHELIERAERAEALAFEAIAETTEVGRQRDAALKKLHELEKTRQ